jgi:hypothetical protein
MGSKSELQRTLVAGSSGKPVAFGVQSSLLERRTRHDSNVWPPASEVFTASAKKKDQISVSPW